MARGPVLHMADYAAPYSGSFIGSLLALELRLRRRGYETLVALPEGAAQRAWYRTLAKNGLRTAVLPRSRIAQWQALAALVRTERPVVVHTHFTAHDVAAAVASTTVGGRASVVWHIHSAFPVRRTAARMLKDVIKFRCLGTAAHAIAASDSLRAGVVERGLPADRVCVVPNGIVTERAEASMSKSEARQVLGVDPECSLILAFGWDPVTKGVDTLINAVRALPEAVRIVLMLVGEDRLVRFVHNTAHGVNCMVVGPREDVAVYFRAADVFVSASRWEGFSYALAEALVSRTPTVASRIPGVAWAFGLEAVRFFEAGDAGGLSSALMDVLCAPGLEEERERAAGVVTAKYSVERWADDVLERYATWAGVG
jgi:glycosyltransferase involved in cell wall biosynthesis